MNFQFLGYLELTRSINGFTALVLIICFIILAGPQIYLYSPCTFLRYFCLVNNNINKFYHSIEFSQKQNIQYVNYIMLVVNNPANIFYNYIFYWIYPILYWIQIILLDFMFNNSKFVLLTYLHIFLLFSNVPGPMIISSVLLILN